MKYALLILLISFQASANHKDPSDSEVQYYRDLTLKVRRAATFKVPMPSGADMQYNYNFEFADPVYAKPLVGDIHMNGQDDPRFSRDFFDRILLKEGSTVHVGGEDLPLTCIFIFGQDNRYAGPLLPTFPVFVMRVYLVANDFSCTGPINPGWPENGGKKETWDTYVYYEVRDPTIMLPVEGHIRYRWNEFTSVLVK